MTISPKPLAGLFLAAALLATGGCAAAGEGEPEAAYEPAMEGYADQPAAGYAEDAAAAGEGAAEAPEAPGQPAGVGQPQVIVSGELTLDTAHPVADFDRARRIVEEAGGHIESMDQSGAAADAEGQWVSATARVPSEQFAKVVDAIEELGENPHLTIRSEDVSTTIVDLDARISGLKTSIKRLEELMSKAANVSSLLEVETELTNRQNELDSLEGRRAHLGAQVAMSTLTVTMGESAAAVTPTRAGFTGSVRRGWNALTAFATGLLDVLGLFLPWLIPIGIILAIVLPLLRRRRKSAARRAAQTPRP
ncbi:MAG: DUF4349 domain-containing protein, partial [Bifidobacteriaceae bacterium]|nr:DUF4349 domain-containing protein [Bifidobacteriaceae bacterium]